MTKSTIVTAKFKNGVIKPKQKLNLREGEDIIVIIRKFSKADTFQKAAGGWSELIDAETFIRDLYNTRIYKTRPKVKL